MTPRRRRRAITELRAEDVPALAAFATGYLHEDLVPEYGDALGAAAAFCRDASEGERQALARDLDRLTAAARTWPAATLARFFRLDVRAAWRPTSIDEVVALASAVSSSSR